MSTVNNPLPALADPPSSFPGLPDDEEAGLDSGFLVMTAEQIKDIFDPVVKEVCDLVQGQVDTLRAKGGVVSGIILVGGFGQSDYLYRRLKNHFTSAAPPPYSEIPTNSNIDLRERPSIEVMQPVYAWTAVVRGAVLRGLEGNMVISRKSRMHYGTSYATVYDEAKHSVTERYWSPLWERWMVSDRMQWHIAKVALPLPPSSLNKKKIRKGKVLTPDMIPGRSHLPPPTHRLPLHAQLPPGPVAARHRRPDRLRGRRAAARLHARPGARVHADNGFERRPAQPVYAPDHDEGRRV